MFPLRLIFANWSLKSRFLQFLAFTSFASVGFPEKKIYCCRAFAHNGCNFKIMSKYYETFSGKSAAAVDFFLRKPTEAKLVKAKNWRNQLFRLQLANMSLRGNNQIFSDWSLKSRFLQFLAFTSFASVGFLEKNLLLLRFRPQWL